MTTGSMETVGITIHLCKTLCYNFSFFLEHDCSLEDFVHVSPNATVCGVVSIGNGTHVGAGAIIIPEIKIGEHCVIGAGTVVINDIPSHSKVVGNPGRIL
jgi:acetyltransferase EpsM